VEVEDVEALTKLMSVLSMLAIILINVWMILSIASDLFYIDVGKVIEEISEYGWRLPPDWVEAHRAEIDLLLMVLLIILLIDTSIYTIYSSKKEEISLAYRLAVSAIEAPVALILYLAGFTVYGVIFFFAIGSLVVVMIKRQQEPVWTVSEKS